MIEAIPQYSHISEKEYYALEERAEIKHDYLDGEIFDMSDGSPDHALLVLNVGAAIAARLHGHPCYATSSEQRIKIEHTGLITYPDVAIVCPPARYDPANSHTLLNPRAVVEVLSRTTEDYDQRIKIEHYSSVESLTHYILVRQDRVEVVRYERETGGKWSRSAHTARSSALRLRYLGLDVPLDEIYEPLDLPEVSAER